MSKAELNNELVKTRNRLTEIDEILNKISPPDTTPMKTLKKPKRIQGKITDKDMVQFLSTEKETYKKSAISEQQLLLLNKLYFKDKVIFGLGLHRIYGYLKDNYPEYLISQPQILRYLKVLEITQLFKQTDETKDLSKTIMSAPFQRMEMDLLDMTSKQQKGYKWIFNMIDVFSKYAISIPLKDKTEAQVLTGFKKMITKLKKEFNNVPSTILSDNGSEFINAKMKEYMKSLNIKQIFTKPHTVSSHAKQVENFNGYLRKQITKYTTQFNDPDWVDFYQLLISNYNNTQSRITMTTPIKVMNGDVNNQEIKDNIRKAILPKEEENGFTVYEKGMKVRLKQYTPTFEKPTNNINWSREIYEIIRVVMPRSESILQPKYKVKMIEDENNKKVNTIINEFFYKNDLQPIETNIIMDVKQKPSYIISKIEGERMRNGNKELLIKWKGYPDKTWERYDDILQDAPKLVNKWNKSK